MTYQRPAYEEITIAHGDNTVTLRPSLRAVTTLEDKFGLPAIEKGLAELDFTIISEIIRTASSPLQDAAAFLAGIPGKPLSPFFAAIADPLAELISMFIPAPVQQLDTAPRTGKPMPWPEFYAGLYDVATGWLGWTPAEAWAATPTEISRAYTAHEHRLEVTGILKREKHGSKQADPEQAARNEAAGLDPEFDRAGLQALKMKIGGGV